MKANKFTFKKGKRETGLVRVASGTPDITILLNGKDVGFISHNDGPFGNGLGVEVRIRVERQPTPDCSCNWRNAKLKRRFETGEAAMAYMNENFESLSKMIFREI